MECFQRIKKMTGSQLFATSWLGLGFTKTPITADKREIKDFPKFAYRRTPFIRKTLSETAARSIDIYTYVLY
jgi:hypothetical protein